MREAIGGAWLYYIFVVMIMFIISFLAIFLNYMAAYRANNHLISVLEQSEGIMPAGICGKTGRNRARKLMRDSAISRPAGQNFIW